MSYNPFKFRTDDWLAQRKDALQAAVTDLLSTVSPSLAQLAELQETQDELALLNQELDRRAAAKGS